MWRNLFRLISPISQLFQLFFVSCRKTNDLTIMILSRFRLSFLHAGFLLFLLFPMSIIAFAQNEVSYKRGATQLEDILPPSPEAASRVKYADVPFTHSTGGALTFESAPFDRLTARRVHRPGGPVSGLRCRLLRLRCQAVQPDPLTLACPGSSWRDVLCRKSVCVLYGESGESSGSGG